jgi:hypothetical protein
MAPTMWWSGSGMCFGADAIGSLSRRLGQVVGASGGIFRRCEWIGH